MPGDRTWISGWQHTLTTQATSTSFTALAVTQTKPETDNTAATAHLVVPFPEKSKEGNNLLSILPYGVGAANTTFDIKVVGWRVISSAIPHATGAAPAGKRGEQASNGIWIPTTFGIYSITLGTMTGIDGTGFEDENKLADTIAETTSTGTPSFGAHADNVSSSLTIDLLGCQFADIYFDMTGATSGNVFATTL
jgi:hypothetical protein